MTVRKGIVSTRLLTIAAALVLPLVLAGCSTSPDPYFGWGTQGFKKPKTAVIKPTPRPNPDRYASNRNDPYSDCTNRYCDRSQQDARNSSGKWDQQASRDDDYDSHYRNNTNNYPASTNVRFQWPTRGRIVSDFGSTGGGERNNGINIATSYREPIRAAADGVVSYSGNELRGYGNLALIRHDNGYITAYAHADEFIVAKGEHVARGQVIGYVGQTGDVRTPQLHFELRKGVRGETPVDPRPYLGPLQVANR